MLQQRILRFDRRFFIGVAMCAILVSCDQPPAPSAAPADATDPTRVTVVSLVPAATDLILGMGAGNQLMAVSNWDADRPELAALPRVGDYRTQDWEKIAALKPHVMIVQFRPDKMPVGMRQRADQYGIRLLNVKINRLEDVFITMQAIGEAIGATSQAAEAQRRLRQELETVRSAVAGQTPVRTLIARTSRGLDVVGGGNFLDELLTLAGGRNVLDTGENSYPTIDREMLLSLNPDVVLQVMPGATPQEIEQAHAFWQTVPQVAAVRHGRVHFLTDSDLLLPGYSVGRIAALFAERLHPPPVSEDGSTSKDRL